MKDGETTIPRDSSNDFNKNIGFNKEIKRIVSSNNKEIKRIVSSNNKEIKRIVSSNNKGNIEIIPKKELMSDEGRKIIEPLMSIEYRIERGILTGGTFDNVPEDACSAYIHSSFPVVNANGGLGHCHDSFNLFVGSVLEISDVLEKEGKGDSKLANRLTAYRENGYENICDTALGFMPFSNRDAAFDTHEEMVSAIAKINSAWNSLYPLSQDPKIEETSRKK